MLAWKQVDATDAHWLEAGPLKLGTWRDYGTLENGRGDPYDSSVAVHSGRLHSGDYNHFKALQRIGLVSADADHDPHSNIIAAYNTIVVRAPEYLILCMSECGCSHNPNPDTPKALFEISGIHTMARRLMRLHPDRLGRYKIQRVKYRRREYSALESEYPAPDPFVKSERFSVEREIRLVFSPKTAGEQTTLFTTPDAEIARLLARKL